MSLGVFSFYDREQSSCYPRSIEAALTHPHNSLRGVFVWNTCLFALNCILGDL